MFLIIYLFFIPFITFAFLVLLPPRRNSDPSVYVGPIDPMTSTLLTLIVVFGVNYGTR